jgi:flagellar biosynthetic protein FliR
LSFWGLDVFAIALIFARTGSAIMLLPGFGEAAIPPRVRLAFALSLALALGPMLAPVIPKAPAQISNALGLLVSEIAVGLLIGGVARVLMAALATAGQIIGLETGLSFAQTADPTQGQAGGQVIAIFLNLMGVAMIFATDLHHQFIMGIVGSYQLFAFGKFPPMDDTAQLAIKVVGDSFRIGVQIAAPLMLAGIVFRIGLGMLNRLIPQIQVFFVAMPANVLGGFIIMALGLSGGMLLWLDRLDQFSHTLQ